MFKINSTLKIAGLISVLLIASSFTFSSLAYEKQSQSGNSCDYINSIDVHCGKTPSSVFDQYGRLWVVFEYQNTLYVSTSEDNGKSFSATTKVNSIPEPIYTNGENRPKIVVGIKDEIYISWTKKTEGRFTGDIRFSRSLDSGKSFSTPVTINDDGLLTSHRFDSVKVTKDGTVFMSWIDKRNNFTRDKEGIVSKKKGMKQNGAIYTSFSVDSGQSFSKNEKLAESSCVCCRIAMTPTFDNAIALSWRNIYPGNIRDHSFAIIDSNGIKQPTARVSKDNWKIDACPHHGPSITEDKNRKLHLVWFTASSTRKGIFYGGLNPQAEDADNLVNISNMPSASHPAILSNGDKLIVVWKEFDGVKTQVMKTESKDFGKSWETSKTINETIGESDHPLLIANGDDIWLSWSSDYEGLRLTKIKYASLEG